MPKILQLSAHVADMIAAGEVVERPASVVKELLENAIDAGSTQIDTEIENGGMTLIRVSDDGCGIADGDTETAFLRHATSKIREADDLEHIRTLGFRGEALAATAAVSRIELLTKTADAETGTRLLLEGGVVRLHEETGCPNGTTIFVRDLFYNTPARMKFMKRDSVEASAVLGAVQTQALAHPEIAFRFRKDGEQALVTDGSGALLSAIYQVYGRQFAAGLTEVSGKWDRFSVSGYLTRPTESFGNRSRQLFFVNGRAVKSRLLTAALEEAYRNQIMVGRFPGCVLMLTAPEDTVDVNVHPAKTEVKFLSEQDVFDCVRYAAEAALKQTPGKPEAHFAQPKNQAQPAAPVQPKKDFYRTMSAEDYKAFLTQIAREPVTASPAVAKAVLQRDEVRVADQIQLPLPTPRREAPPQPEKAPDAPWRIAGEVLNTYIIVEQGEDVYFLDKHAAHERILFEKYKANPQPIAIQTLLTPVSASLTPEEAAIALENAELLEAFGFALEDFGAGSVLIRGVPADLDPDDAQAALAMAAADLLSGKRLKPEDLRDNLLHTVACKAAIKAGWHTDPLEQQRLVDEVFRRDDLKYCPHGRPICIKLTKSAIERQFGRA